MGKVVSSHFIESLLRFEDIIDKIDDNEAMIDSLYRIANKLFLKFFGLRRPSFGKKKGVHI